MSRERAPRCLRCGRPVPKHRRHISDYCTLRCARQSAYADEESAREERALTEGSSND